MPLLQRLTVVVTAFLSLAPASDFGRFARAADPAPTAHESSVLDRVFANWKTRHDRVRSFHFTYNRRTTYRKGKWDLSSEPRVPFEHDQAFEQVGMQLWVDGDERICSLDTPSFKVPAAKRIDTRRVATRSVTAGNTCSIYYASSAWETGRPRPHPLAPNGVLYSRAAPLLGVRNIFFQALFVTFRPQTTAPSLLRDQCRLVDENAVIDNGHYVKFHRVFPDDSEEALWVSPARDDVVVHWTSSGEGSRAEGSIKYKKDERYGWIPSEWTCDFVGGKREENKVTDYSINEKIDSAVFSEGFPPGTPVEDGRDVKFGEPSRYYVIQPDGSKRSISHEEFDRLANIANPLKRAPAAKPQAK
jgi:hypothetical protein